MGYRTEVIVIAQDGYTELRLPNEPEPVILRPGQRFTLTFATELLRTVTHPTPDQPTRREEAK